MKNVKKDMVAMYTRTLLSVNGCVGALY